jgi:hypothetical protein
MTLSMIASSAKYLLTTLFQGLEQSAFLVLVPRQQVLRRAVVVILENGRMTLVTHVIFVKLENTAMIETWQRAFRVPLAGMPLKRDLTFLASLVVVEDLVTLPRLSTKQLVTGALLADSVKILVWKPKCKTRMVCLCLARRVQREDGRQLKA